MGKDIKGTPKLFNEWLSPIRTVRDFIKALEKKDLYVILQACLNLEGANDTLLFYSLAFYRNFNKGFWIRNASPWYELSS